MQHLFTNTHKKNVQKWKQKPLQNVPKKSLKSKLHTSSAKYISYAFTKVSTPPEFRVTWCSEGLKIDIRAI